MKLLHTQSLRNAIEENTKQLEAQIEQYQNLENSIQDFISLENSFNGKGGKAIRLFYQDWHVPLVEYFQLSLKQYQQKLLDLKQATIALEPAKEGMIREEFLDGELTNGLKNTETNTISLVDDVNASLSTVSDIVSIPKLSDQDFLSQVQHARNEIDETIHDLQQFDHRQTSYLVEMKQDIQQIIQYIDEMKGLMIGGKINVSTYQSGQLNHLMQYKQLKVSLEQKQLQEMLSMFGSYLTTFWNIFGRTFISSSPTYSYELLKGYERDFAGVAELSGADHPNAQEFVDGTHQVAKGKDMDLSMLEEMDGVAIETFNLRGVPMNYAIINDRLVIFRNEPDLWYYTQNTEYGLTEEIFGQIGKTTASAFGEYFIGKGASKIPGASALNNKMGNMPDIPGTGANSGDLLKEQASESIQKQIPFWKEIVSAEVPKSGTKQVLVYIGGDGENWDRRAMITMSSDGVVSIDDWYVGELSETVKKDKAETTFSDMWNWATDTVDENNSTKVNKTQKEAINKYGLSEGQELTPGGGYDLNHIQNDEGLNIHTTTIDEQPINYTVVGGNLVIIPDNPDLYFSQTTIDHNALTQNMGDYAKKIAESAGNRAIGEAVGRVPGADNIDGWLQGTSDVPLTGKSAGELITSTSSKTLQSNIPGWEKIVNAPVPSSGEKQVLLQISEDGKEITGTKLFYLKKDGTVELR